MAHHHNQKQIDHYDKVYADTSPSHHRQVSDSTKYYTNRFLDNIIKPYHKNILEVGSGDGLLTEFLLDRQLNVTAIDISSAATTSLKQKFSDSVKSQKLIVVCDDVVQYLQNTDSKFDLIVGSGILHHIDVNQWVEFFVLAKKHLSDGGVIAFAPEPNADGLYQYIWHLARFCYKLMNIDFDPEVEKGTFDMKSNKIKQALSSAGFVNIKLSPFQTIPHFQINQLDLIDRMLVNNANSNFALYQIITAENKR